MNDFMQNTRFLFDLCHPQVFLLPIVREGVENGDHCVLLVMFLLQDGGYLSADRRPLALSNNCTLLHCFRLHGELLLLEVLLARFEHLHLLKLSMSAAHSHPY